MRAKREGNERIGAAGADRGISNKGQAEPQKPTRLKMIFFLMGAYLVEERERAKAERERV